MGNEEGEGKGLSTLGNARSKPPWGNTASIRRVKKPLERDIQNPQKLGGWAAGGKASRVESRKKSPKK